MSHSGKLNSAASLCSGYIAETPKGKGNQWIRLIGAIKSHFSFTIFSPSAKATPSLQVFNDVAYHTYQTLPQKYLITKNYLFADFPSHNSVLKGLALLGYIALSLKKRGDFYLKNVTVFFSTSTAYNKNYDCQMRKSFRNIIEGKEKNEAASLKRKPKPRRHILMFEISSFSLT